MRYGDYEDDFDEHGRGRSRDRGLDHERDRDRDSDRDADRDSDRDGGGSGSERDDERDDDGLMTMTRRDSERDVRDLYNSSLDDMRRFLREREGAEDPMKSVTSNAVVGLEIVAGAALAGFLAQRFRQAGAVVPVGITLAALGLAAAQFNKAGKFSPDLRNVSFGALASAVALWAAGRGMITTEAAAFGPNTAGMLPGAAAPAAPSMFFAQPVQVQQMQPPPAQWMQPPMQRPVPAFVPQRVQPMMDFHNLVAQRAGR